MENKLLLVERAKQIGDNLQKINEAIKSICDGDSTIGIYGSGMHGKLLYKLINKELEKKKLKTECILFDSNEMLVG